MKAKLLTFAGALVALGVLGSFSTPSLMAETKPVVVQDSDQAARAAFQQAIYFDTDDRESLVQTISIPSGFRLVIEFVYIEGRVLSGTNQPLIVFYPALNGQYELTYYFFPQPLSTDPGLYLEKEKVGIYADKLRMQSTLDSVSHFRFTVNVSGHLVKIP